MKITAVSIILTAILIGGTIIFVVGRKNLDNTAPQQAVNNVSLLDGKQIIEISAKGGYSPKVTTAQADMPTVLKIDTLGTFDCSSALAIPSIGYRTNLPPSGSTEIEIPAQKSGSTLRGLCGMGMYNFQIRFN
ncbi:MAG: cupredoxin domain-containing protein [Patescibacteria group bacterium]